jgi:NADH:ubiquinone reductase (H+-translocating)
MFLYFIGMSSVMRVLILGGGYAGIFAASNLYKNKNVQITLVSDSPQLQLLQNIHRVASGELQPRDITLDIQDILGKGVIFVKGKSEKVDLVAKQAEIVLTESGMVQIIEYDYLINCYRCKKCILWNKRSQRKYTIS